MNQEAIDIMNGTSLDQDDYFLLQSLPQPTPIGFMDECDPVKELSVVCSGETFDDIVSLLWEDDSHFKKRPLVLAAEIFPDISSSSKYAPHSIFPSTTRPTKKQKTNPVVFESDPTNQEQSTKDFHGYQCEKWDMRLQELHEFKQMYGHCSVPNIFPVNPQLAQWVKRQRYQHKLKIQGKRNTLTDERQKVLETVGFVWDSHEAAWMERWNELKVFFDEHGNSNVPTNYDVNRQLWIWVKCQRRQYKLFQSGRPSNMTTERIAKMESLHFNWNPRNLKL